MTTNAVQDVVVETARLWSGVAVPNQAALELAADLQQVLRGFEKLRGRMRFEDEPASFEAALRDGREPA